MLAYPTAVSVGYYNLTLYPFVFSHSSGNTLCAPSENAGRRCQWVGATAGSADGQDAYVAEIGVNCAGFALPQAEAERPPRAQGPWLDVGWCRAGSSSLPCPHSLASSSRVLISGAGLSAWVDVTGQSHCRARFSVLADLITPGHWHFRPCPHEQPAVPVIQLPMAMHCEVPSFASHANGDWCELRSPQARTTYSSFIS